jgi:hypothetical protein
MIAARAAGALLAGLFMALPMADRGQAQSPPPLEAAVPVAGDPRFGNQRETLRRLVQRNGRRGRNDLCVVGLDLGNGQRSAWVLWRQDRSIILWARAPSGRDDLWLSPRYLRVPRDVATDLHGSTYMVTPEWVASLRQACERIGQHFTFMKR